MSIQTRKPCVVGNWKMQGSRQMISTLMSGLSIGLSQKSQIDIVLCPPVIYLQEVQRNLQSQGKSLFELGAQNVYCESAGAYTGEVSPSMLVDIGCRYVIIGHSERRTLLGEDDALIARKFRAAYDAGLIPILCVGETEKERALGKTPEVIRRQLEAVFKAESSLGHLPQALIAYEPVWAIGTGLTATPEQAEEVHQDIRNWIQDQDPALAQEARILYGGSVKASNASGLFAKSNIDGALVGGASLVAEEFLSICNSANKR